tara:strand:- start:161 stop:460 length:300 start_codon:yes stop_codon:yes gene_type:complete
MISTSVFHSPYAYANDFEVLMKVWDQKRTLATESLLDAEKYLKQGDKAKGCASQRKASRYGIEATESLVKAMKINGSTEGLQGFESGLNKWRELGDFCE